MIKTQKAQASDLQDLYDCSALTMEGMCSDEENLKDIFDYLVEIGACSEDDDIKMYIITGKQMNTEYGLTGDNAYKANLTIISFPLKQFKDVSKWCLKAKSVGFRWFDDIVDNNARREER